MNNTEERSCKNCLWWDWCDVKNPNGKLCGLYGDEVTYERSLIERAEVYFGEILDYDDGRIEMF